MTKLVRQHEIVAKNIFEIFKQIKEDGKVSFEEAFNSMADKSSFERDFLFFHAIAGWNGFYSE